MDPLKERGDIMAFIVILHYIQLGLNVPSLTYFKTVYI